MFHGPRDSADHRRDRARCRRLPHADASARRFARRSRRRPTSRARSSSARAWRSRRSRRAKTAGGLVLRCVNLTDESIAGAWRLPFDAAEAHAHGLMKPFSRRRASTTTRSRSRPRRALSSRCSFANRPRCVEPTLDPATSPLPRRRDDRAGRRQAACSASTVAMSASPGAIATHGATTIRSRPPAIMLPQLGSAAECRVRETTARSRAESRCRRRASSRRSLGRAHWGARVARARARDDAPSAVAASTNGRVLHAEQFGAHHARDAHPSRRDEHDDDGRQSRSPERRADEQQHEARNGEQRVGQCHQRAIDGAADPRRDRARPSCRRRSRASDPTTPTASEMRPASIMRTNRSRPNRSVPSRCEGCRMRRARRAGAGEDAARRRCRADPDATAAGTSTTAAASRASSAIAAPGSVRIARSARAITRDAADRRAAARGRRRGSRTTRRPA